jgi:hypothetical protein
MSPAASPAGATVVCLAGWLWCRPSLPPARSSGPWFSVFGFLAALVSGLLGAIWLDARRTRQAGRSGAAWGYCGLGVAVFVAVIGLFSWFGGMP